MGRPFFFRISEIVQRNNSLLCVGLDPQPGRFAGEDILTFNRRIIDATADLVCAFKPNFAFYEAQGLSGLEALRETIAYIHEKCVPAILDAKRGDIGSTAQAYADAAFRVWGADAITLNPYLGKDSIAPFADYEDRGVLVLCHTSNPGAGELQTLDVEGRPLYERVAEISQHWSQYNNIGLVVGATYPKVLSEIRRLLPDTWFLVPGIGAQGGDLATAVDAGLDVSHQGLIVNAGRSVIYADNPREAALKLRNRINDVRAQHQVQHGGTYHVQKPDSSLSTEIILALHELQAIQFGEFTLKSGQISPIYIDLRLLVSDAAVMRLAAQAYAKVTSTLSFDRIAAIPFGGLPIGQAVALELGRPLIYPRKDVKTYGTGNKIEGRYLAGETAIVLDDLITNGSSKFEALEPLKEAGLQVKDVVVLIDREQGGAAELEKAGYQLHSVLTISKILEVLFAKERISRDLKADVEAFLSANESGM